MSELSDEVGAESYTATIRRTTHGVAHIEATDWGSLGFGQGYACATDHIDTLADQILKVRSERARFFGPGANDRHVHSDLGYLALGVSAAAERMHATQEPWLVELVEGYAAGVNHYLATSRPEDRPTWCRGAPWVRPVSALDLFAMYADLALMGSGRNLVEMIGSARPPGDAATDAPPFRSDTPGSNGWAFGRRATANGRGMVVANPHFPWYGDGRFGECHLTIPGELDVYGAALIGTPGVQIGFNRSVAWAHTFSRGHRFTIYKLELDRDDPTRYRFGHDTREMTPAVHAVDVAIDGGIERRALTTWSTHHGPVVNLPILGWTDTNAFSYRDANLDNDHVISTFLAMNRASTVSDLRDAIAAGGGLPWVNTLAADADGDAWYSDMSTTPKLSEAADARYRTRVVDDPLVAFAAAQRIALLDGSDPLDDWTEVHSTEALPERLGDGAHFNSNDPYWWAGPGGALGLAPAMCGRHGAPLSPRSRMNGHLMTVAEQERWTADDAARELLSNRSHMAEQFLDGVLDHLRAALAAPSEHGVTDDASTRDALGRAVDSLASWDRTYDCDSRGAVLWREFLAGYSDDDLRLGSGLAARLWDVRDPIDSPSGVVDDTAGIARRVLDAVALLDRLGFDADVRLGDVQFVERSGRRIELHGGNEVEGIVNVVAPIGAMSRSDLAPPVGEYRSVPGRTERTGLHHEGYPVTYGASFVMVVSFGDDGPEGRGLLVYGQSGNPDSPHHVDQVDAFAQKALRPLRFRRDDVLADPNLSTTMIRCERSAEHRHSPATDTRSSSE